MLAWLGHRLSGAALMFYLFLHIFATRELLMGARKAVELKANGDIAGAEAAWHAVYGFVLNPIVGLGEILLLAAVLYHAVNGLRVMAVDFFGGARYQKQLWIATVAATAALFAVFGGLMFIHWLHLLQGGV
jgi:succinate dehydrogenase / fumarate reductase cytochrome b subunit